MSRPVLIVTFCFLLLGTASLIKAASIASAVATEDIDSPIIADEGSVPKESSISNDNNDLATDATIYWGYKPAWRYYGNGWGDYRRGWGGGWKGGWGGYHGGWGGYNGGWGGYHGGWGGRGYY